MTPKPYLAPSLVALRHEIDGRWPNRDRASDGWLGDASHAARQSDHNPDERGMVHAIDVDKDGIDVAELLAATISDPRVWYVIHNRTIWSRTYGWLPKPYTGTNAHTEHIHVSIRYQDAAEQDTSPWLGNQEDDDMATPEETAAAVAHRKLGNGGYLGWNITDTRERLVRVEAGLTALAKALGPTVEQAVEQALAEAVVDVDVTVHNAGGGA